MDNFDEPERPELTGAIDFDDNDDPVYGYSYIFSVAKALGHLSINNIGNVYFCDHCNANGKWIYGNISYNGVLFTSKCYKDEDTKLEF